MAPTMKQDFTYSFKNRLVGAHMSTAGGASMAIGRGSEFGCTAIQLFTKSNRFWFGKAPSDEEAEKFKKALAESEIGFVFSHAGYLINFAAPDAAIYEKSMQSMRQEMDYAEKLGIDWVNVHPGSHREQGEEIGIEKIAASIRQLLDSTSHYSTGILLETTAGQGSCIGHRFEQLAEILSILHHPERLGVCIDTCHIFSAGYDIRTEKGVESVINEFDQLVGLNYLKAFHFNDSKFDLGTRKDRHEHIGEGLIGKEAFGWILNDKRFTKIPMVLETPKGEDNLEDSRNLQTLFSLIKK